MAKQLFGSRVELVERYAELLATDAVDRGLLGPREVERIWERHLLNCAVVTEAIPPGARICDVGSGAGLPGVVVALRRPDLQLTLLEPMLRRWTFLREAIVQLNLEGQVKAVRERAEDHDSRYAVVMARAVAPLGRLAGVALQLCEPGGQVLAIKGARAEVEMERAAGELRRAGARSWTIERHGVGVIEPPTTVVRVVAGDRSASR